MWLDPGGPLTVAALENGDIQMGLISPPTARSR